MYRMIQIIVSLQWSKASRKVQSLGLGAGHNSGLKLAPEFGYVISDRRKMTLTNPDGF